MSCYCVADLHHECIAPNDKGECCCVEQAEEFFIGFEDEPLQPEVKLPKPKLKPKKRKKKKSKTRVEKTETSVPKRTRALKDSETLKDVLSTGRKRAAEAYPVTDGMLCEWAGLLYAGGGVFPIIGCDGNRLYTTKDKHARHHGPDKSTTNNSQGNVHRICVTCHNRWHTLNDQFYGKRPEGGAPFIPLTSSYQDHDPVTPAEQEDIEHAEVWWATPLKERKAMRRNA